MRYGLRMVPRLSLAVAVLVVLTVAIPASGAVTDHENEPRLSAPEVTTANVLGIDVSAYQHGVDWKKVAAAGATFAYIKATEGSTYTNARLREQYTGAAKAGLVRGAFHFAKPNVSTPEAQARYFVASLKTLGGGRVDGATTLPPLLDLEYNPYTKKDGTNSCWGLTPKQMVEWVAAFTATVVELTDRVPAIYTTTDWWQRCTADSTAFSGNPLFLARYVKAASAPSETTLGSGPGQLPAGWSTWTFWQHTNAGTRYSGVTDGSKGNVHAADEDVFHGSPADLEKLARSTFSAHTGLEPELVPLAESK